MCKTLCFHALPKSFQIEDIQIYYSCPPLEAQIRQFYVQNLVFACLPKSISNRKFSTMLFLPTPENLDSTILFAKRGVLMPSKCISNRRYSNTFFLSTPARPDSFILCAKCGVLKPSQRHFKYKIFK